MKFQSNAVFYNILLLFGAWQTQSVLSRQFPRNNKYMSRFEIKDTGCVVMPWRRHHIMPWRRHRRHVTTIIRKSCHMGVAESAPSLPSNTTPWSHVGLMLAQRLRRWASIKPTLDQRLVFYWIEPKNQLQMVRCVSRCLPAQPRRRSVLAQRVKC